MSLYDEWLSNTPKPNSSALWCWPDDWGFNVTLLCVWHRLPSHGLPRCHLLLLQTLQIVGRGPFLFIHTGCGCSNKPRQRPRHNQICWHDNEPWQRQEGGRRKGFAFTVDAFINETKTHKRADFPNPCSNPNCRSTVAVVWLTQGCNQYGNETAIWGWGRPACIIKVTGIFICTVEAFTAPLRSFPSITLFLWVFLRPNETSVLCWG